MGVLNLNRNNFCKTKNSPDCSDTDISLKIIWVQHYVQGGERQKDSLKSRFIRISKDYLARNVNPEIQPLGGWGHLVIPSENKITTVSLTLSPFGLSSFLCGDIF